MRARLGGLAAALALGAAPAGAQWGDAERVTIASSVDGAPQAAYFYDPAPGIDVPVPLLVALHSWSSDYTQASNAAFVALARERGWVLIHPDFRGPNVRPEAAGSDLVVADLLDAVAYARRRRPIDSTRVYLVGASGGGFTALVAAARAPGTWAAVSAWVAIADLERWHAYSRTRDTRYWRDIEAVVGGDPGVDPGARRAARARSPRYLLDTAHLGGLALDLNVGIDDGLVRPSQTLLAFNAVAAAADTFTAAQLDRLDAERAVPPELRREGGDDPFLEILLERASRGHRVRVFAGGHEIDREAAVAWLGSSPGDGDGGPVGVASGHRVARLRVWPSPAPGRLLRFEAAWPVDVATLVDLSGRVVARREGVGAREGRLEVGPLAAGPYVLRVRGRDAAASVLVTLD